MKRSTCSVLLAAAVAACGGDSRGDPTGIFGNGLGGLGADGGAVLGNGNNPGGTGSGTCEAKLVNSGRIEPDILIVLDRSGSMRMNGVNRWDPSVSGITSIVSMLEDRVRFGLMMFPGTGGGRGDNNCTPGSLNVGVGDPGAADSIIDTLSDTDPGGRTPTSQTLAAVRQVIGDSSADGPISPKYVLLVTDGAPNCINNGTGSLPGGGQPEAVEASITELKALTQAKVKTYVLGYNTQSDPQLKAALDRMAAEGGTGDTSHRAIEDEASLVAQFRAITDTAITCDFVLENAVNNPNNVKVLFDGTQIFLNKADGFKMGADKKTITLQGSTCTKIKEPGHSISISVECTSQVPI